jgi:hypothetical protein
VDGITVLPTNLGFCHALQVGSFMLLCHPCRQFTDTAIGLSMVLLNAGIDLISFSGILYSIYPPLFVALLVRTPACVNHCHARNIYSNSVA